MNKIVVLKGTDPYKDTLAAVKRLKIPRLEGKRILLKPNASRIFAGEPGVNTSPAVIASLIDFFQKNRPSSEIAVGEGALIGVDVMEAFESTGLAKVAKERGVPLLDIDSFDPVTLHVPQSKLVSEIKVSGAYRQFDFIVSVPVMKTHMHTGVSLSLKNMKGFLHKREKVKMHHLSGSPGDPVKSLDIGIADMASVLQPHLAVIDGSIGQEGLGPSAGSPKPAGLIVAGLDFIRADLVAARLMGFDPMSFDHLRLAAARLSPGLDVDKIPVDPEDYLKYKERFEPPPESLDLKFPDVVLHEYEACSACLSSLFLFLKAFHGKINFDKFPDGKLHLYLGKNVKKVDHPGAVLLGNCTLHCRKDGLFISGCPPISSTIFAEMRKLDLVSGEFEQD
jgi:uncharacterized protein (DUF362 family)